MTLLTRIKKFAVERIRELNGLGFPLEDVIEEFLLEHPSAREEASADELTQKIRDEVRAGRWDEVDLDSDDGEEELVPRSTVGPHDAHQDVAEVLRSSPSVTIRPEHIESLDLIPQLERQLKRLEETVARLEACDRDRAIALGSLSPARTLDTALRETSDSIEGRINEKLDSIIKAQGRIQDSVDRCIPANLFFWILGALAALAAILAQANVL